MNITVDGIPLELYLENRDEEGFIKSIREDNKKKRAAIYHGRKTHCQQHHDTKPGPIKHLTKEEYMSKNYIGKSPHEIALIALSECVILWRSAKDIVEYDPQYSKQAYAGALKAIVKRFPFLLKTRKGKRRTEYTMLGDFKQADVIELWRGTMTVDHFQQTYQAFIETKTELTIVERVEILEIDLNAMQLKLDSLGRKDKTVVAGGGVAGGGKVEINVYIVKEE